MLYHQSYCLPMQIDSYQKTINELQMQLERCRHELDEAQQRSKQDRSEKDVKMMLLESEVDRVRSTVTSKNEQLEELMEQKQRDRSQVLELKEQLSHLSSDLTTAQADLEHEQAHRKRLELRLRSFMTTPELNNNSNNNNNYQGNNNNTTYDANGTIVGGVDYDSLDGGSSSSSNSTGGMLSTNYYQQYRDRDDSDFSVRPSSRSGLVSYTMADKIGNTSNNNNNYQANNKLSMQHTEDYYDNSDCNTVQSTSTRVLPYNSSASTGTYNNNNNNNNNSYSQSSYNSTYAIHDDGSSDHRLLQPTPLQLQQSAASSTPRADHHRMTHHTYSESVSSPALDRVSVALAARAVADSSSSIGGGGVPSDRFSSNRTASSSSSSTTDSKSALRLAQQQRNVGRHPNNNNNNNYQGNNISSISGGNTSMTSQGISLISDPDVLSYNANDDSPSSAMAYNSNNYSGTNINNMGGNNSVGVSAEETIRRTQMVLNKRMGLNAHATATSMGPSKGASTLKLTETIHHAHAMYPPSPVTSRGSSINAQDRDGTGGGLMMDVPVPAPQLRPISPPIVRHTMMMMGGGGGASIALGDEDMSSEFMVEYFNNNNNNNSSSSSSPSGMNISTINSSVTSTVAIASSASTLQATSSDKRSSSASKKKKSSSSSSSSSSKQNQIAVETGRNYGGLEDALQLPKISHLNHGGKKK